MAPGPQGNVVLENIPDKGSSDVSNIDGEGVVISGMSGLFPMSHHVKEFSKNLYDQVNMVSNNPRYKYNHPELQQYCGVLPGLDLFDAHFFGIHYNLTYSMDSMSRKLLELTYQAIYDAGLSPVQSRNYKMGVFIGSCFSETEKACFYVGQMKNGFGIMGCCKAMFANRISYWLDAKGPSISMDAMCSSSVVALERAVEAIRNGDCDCAVVGSSNICLHPQTSILYGRTMQMSMDGKTRCFDKYANGASRSEAINVIFLQKAKHAKRIYAEVCHTKTSFTPVANVDGQTKYGPLRPISCLREFFKDFYLEANVSPTEVQYIEGFGTAIPEAEKNELEAIDQTFCKDRTGPLLLGSVMSNMGYSEAASGLSSVVKVCLGYHTGKMAGNIDFTTPRDDLPAVTEGRLQVITDNTPIGESYAAINNFSIGGVNGHILLKGFSKKKDLTRYKSQFPYLVTMSGRQESGVKFIADELKSNAIDPEEIGLIHNIHENSIIGHMARGYCILSTNDENETVVLAEEHDYYADIKRPLWFVYSGMGSQWATMGAELMRIPIFAAAIERCRRVLEPRGVDIVDILTNPDKTTFDNILHSFVGIAAVQIGLTDILTKLGIVPDNIIGHSVGELGCAYADGCFTAEEMILAAYSRGLVSVQTPFIRGSMAAIGLGYNTISKMCPPEIEVACHNGPDSSTISGPADIMKEFVAKLTAQGIFAKEVPCSNIAYHSRYIAEAGPKLLEYLSEVITDPKPRSERWVSTSVPQDKWGQPEANCSSAQYHTNNLLSPVLFEETARLIPQNAVIIEIAPHGLLQAILKRSLGATCTHIPLTRRSHSDPINFLLTAIGKMYKAGLNPKLQVLYPKIEYPVSTGTPHLSHLVQWVHSEFWSIPLYSAANRLIAAQRSFIMSIHDDELKYVEGHNIEGNTTFPFGGLLMLVWETLAMVLQEQQSKLSVQFHNVHCQKQIVFAQERLLKLSVTIQRGSGRFEVIQESVVVIDGFVERVNFVSDTNAESADESANVSDVYELDSVDIYKLLYKRGYNYQKDFRSIQKANLDFTKALLTWNDNWVTFIDSMIQMNILKRDYEGISNPTLIKSISIDTTKHYQDIDNNNNLLAIRNEMNNITSCGGVIIDSIDFVDNLLQRNEQTVLKNQEFMPFFPVGCNDATKVLHAYLQIVVDNINSTVINTIEIVNAMYTDDNVIDDILKQVHGAIIKKKRITIDMMSKQSISTMENLKLLCGFNIFVDQKVYETIQGTVPNKTFVISINNTVNDDQYKSKIPHMIIASANTPLGHITLTRWLTKQEKSVNTTCLSVNNDFKLLKYTRDNIMPGERLIVTTNYPPDHGLIDLVNNWRKETVRNNIQLLMLDRKNSTTDAHLFEATSKDLAFSVSKDGIWGTEFNSPINTEQNRTRDVKLTNIPGQLNTFKWLEVPHTGHGGITVKVHYAGPNINDLEKAIGKGKLNCNEKIPSYGMDFSGITERGQRVMGVVLEGGLSTSVTADPELLWPVPEHWSLKDAATVPQPYAHAFYCLVIKAGVVPENSIFVHGGTGAFGQAVISIALSLGCEVFTTVSSMRKKKLLRKLFPTLKADRIGNSRDESFETMIMNGTNGLGCDIVLSCLKGQLREASFRCVGLQGCYIDVTQTFSNKHTTFGMFHLTQSRNYLPVVFSTIFELQNSDYKKLIQRMISEGITKGFVRPLSRLTYAPQDASRAFRLLSSSGHCGRVLLDLKQLSSVAVTPTISCSSEGCYLVICGKNEFGIDLADRLVSRGVKRLVIHCDSSIRSGFLYKKIKSWQNIGVLVALTTKNLLINNNHISLLNECTKMGVVEGIFMVNQPGSPILDILNQASAKMSPQTKYFVVLRLTSANYSLGEKNILAERKRQGLPVLMLHLPLVCQFNGNEHSVEESNETNNILPQTIKSALDSLEISLRLESTIPISCYALRNDDTVNILRDVSVIAGINITDRLDNNTKLRDLGVDIEKQQAICNYLEETLNLSFNRDKITDLTIVELRNLQEDTDKDQNDNLKKDLSVFFKSVDPEEIEASVESVLMKTLIHSSGQRDDEFDQYDNYLVIVPGLEGHHAMFQDLCERLKMPALLLQPPIDQSHETVQQIAARFLKTIKKRSIITPDSKFYLLGYSFGVSIVMEMAMILESGGQEGTVFCLDSSPEVFPRQLSAVFGEMKEQQIQDTVVEHMFSLMADSGLETLTFKLRTAKTWADKLNVCMQQLCGRVPYSTQYAKMKIESAYGRICTGRRYDKKRLILQPLRSQIILFKAKQQFPELADCAFDYSLQQYSQRAPIVYEFDADHSTIIQDPRCASIINRHLDENILLRFKQRNLCDTYLANPNRFMEKNSTKMS